MQLIFFSEGALQEVYPLLVSVAIAPPLVPGGPLQEVYLFLVSVAIAPPLVPGGPLRDVCELSSIHHSARASLDTATAFCPCNTLHALQVPHMNTYT